MQINKLSLQNFRNYSEQEIAFAPDCNVIVGENAQGKTNLLEAIGYLSCGSCQLKLSIRRVFPI